MICILKSAFSEEKLVEHCQINDLKDTVVNIKCKYGIYVPNEVRYDIATICDRTSLALQSIREEERGYYAFYENTMLDRFLEEYELSDRLDIAMENHEFEVYYQPIYNISKNKIVSAEALIRWNHPVKGFVGPNVFIPLFEKNGAIVKLDRYVWREVCRYIKKCRDEKHPIVPISVNISRADFQNPGLCEVLRGIAKEYEIPDELLSIEMTETAYSDNPNQLLNTVKEFQNKGFRVSMDDFGSGFSSLNILKDIPVDILKIDLKFLEGFEETSRASSIVSSVIRMGKWLGLNIVAEGVETRMQLDFLRSVGCDNAQGYLFSRPVQAHVLKDMLKRNAQETAELSIEDEELDIDRIWHTNEREYAMFDGMIGGMGLYELVDGQLEVLRVNRGYYEIMGGDSEKLFGDIRVVTQHMDEKNKDRLIACCHEAKDSRRIETTRIQRRRHDGKLIWVETKVRYLGSAGKRMVFYLAVRDISDQMQKESQLQEQHMIIQQLINRRGYDVWEYRLATRELFKNQFMLEDAEKHADIKDSFSCFHDSDFIHEDDKEAFYQMFQELLSGKENLEGVFRFKDEKSNQYIKQHISYILCCDSHKVPYKAIGLVREIG